MLEEGRISNKQLQWLIISTIFSTALLFLPSTMIAEAKQDTWLSMILVTIFGLIASYIITKLGQRFPNQTLIGYSRLIVGRIPAKVIAFIYILFFLHIDAVIIREFGEVLTSIFLPNTPMSLIIVIIVVISASGVRNGIEVISRSNEIILPSIFGFLVIIFLFIFPELDAANLRPVLGTGLIPIIKGAYPAALFYAETVILIIILPAVNRPKKALKSVFKATLITGFIGVIVIVEIITLFGSIEAAQFNLPMLSLIRYISIFDFIERIDALMMAIWFGGGFMKIAVFYYCLTISTAEFFELKSYKPVVLPLGVILTVLSIILFGNIEEMGKVIFELMPPYYLFIEVGIPLILLLIAIIRGVRGEIE
ncbi:MULTISPECIES: GerAB/ArcD/ProY family transporter [unclassified Candidatus Frackibacter]|uniref:GerAB/ArcD/ProY family transporter n=1 Tax=unclassified Candidatus Frackibacter TaxID=2648818 RepID=UPI000794BD58|nr:MULTISPECIES: endospore germination permease [unclassified Candidatus Frackibacter]KXS43720.1 MAG: spore germination protein [Candidatus Frackibacter sp. T328-2]SDC20971.1 spore germination protein KB [Candidatus Frackibacter sp. WG11]SEM50808.1 spore germination protein KB [Candidatus Frackibacter sp. WG12]SFL52152.1 spore germination protein KB [Candidatus Frackibacter sp. WG13]